MNKEEFLMMHDFIRLNVEMFEPWELAQCIKEGLIDLEEVTAALERSLEV